MKIRLTESKLRQIVNESIKKILSETNQGIENPWLYSGDDKWGRFNGKIYIGADIFRMVMSKYQYEYDKNLDDFEIFMGELDADPINVVCGWEDSPSINVKDEWIEEVDMEDVENIKKEISTYSNQVLAKQALSVIDEVLDKLSIDDVEPVYDDEPDYDAYDDRK